MLFCTNLGPVFLSQLQIVTFVRESEKKKSHGSIKIYKKPAVSIGSEMYLFIYLLLPLLYYIILMHYENKIYDCTIFS